MSEAKIEIKVGAVSFSGEGTEKWLSEQLDKLLDKVPQLVKVAPPPKHDVGSGGAASGGGGGAGAGASITGTLASYLKEKGATSNQVKKFLATAIYLHDHDKRDSLTTADVSKALSDAHQQALTNPAQSLNNNVSKGFCQKTGGKQFFVTPEGRADIG